MLIIIILCIIFILFIICIMTITLSDTETFKAIDRKIADKIDRKEKRKWENYTIELNYQMEHYYHINLKGSTKPKTLWYATIYTDTL